MPGYVASLSPIKLLKLKTTPKDLMKPPKMYLHILTSISMEKKKSEGRFVLAPKSTKSSMTYPSQKEPIKNASLKK